MCFTGDSLKSQRSTYKANNICFEVRRQALPEQYNDRAGYGIDCSHYHSESFQLWFEAVMGVTVAFHRSNIKLALQLDVFFFFCLQ